MHLPVWKLFQKPMPAFKRCFWGNKQGIILYAGVLPLAGGCCAGGVASFNDFILIQKNHKQA
jgi:hypothetical protein